MSRLKTVGPLILVFAAALLWIVFLSEPGSQWIANLFSPKAKHGLAVGRLNQTSGKVKFFREGQIQEIRATMTAPVELLDGDRIEVDQNSRAVLVLNSQDEFELGPLSAASLQLWNGRDAASAIYLNWLVGTLEHRKPGVKGKAYVVHEGRLYLPGQRPSKKPLALTVPRTGAADLAILETVHGENNDFQEDVVTENESAPPSTPAEYGAMPETLSNEYIDEMMASRQSQFQKCWLPRLKVDPNLKGEIILQFEISQRGKVRDLRVADATLNDETLRNCVMQVVERIPFRAFKGPEISLSYPLTFE